MSPGPVSAGLVGALARTWTAAEMKKSNAVPGMTAHFRGKGQATVSDGVEAEGERRNRYKEHSRRLNEGRLRAGGKEKTRRRGEKRTEDKSYAFC